MPQNEHIQHKLSLHKEDNPQYHALVEKHNSMMVEWNRINKSLHEAKTPRIFPFAFKKKMKVLQIDLESLQKDFIIWNNDAFKFLLNPNLIIPHSSDSEITFLHYSGFLRDLRSKYERNMILIGDNYHRVWDSYSNKVNFRIAIASFVLTFIGLVATLITIK